MKVTIKNIQREFFLAEQNYEFCWELLVDLKQLSSKNEDFVTRLISFQDKLATTIFRLQTIRTAIIAEEKKIIKKKTDYNFEWFKKKMRALSTLKKGVENVINIGKSLGDAYAYFFYQFDIELFNEHLSHQKIDNYSAGSGERGELEFIKNVKHIEGNFNLFHGITNILRYGDYSFIDLKTLRVIGIGELKTKYIDSTNLQLSLTFIKRNTSIKPKKKFHNLEMEKTRIGRQLVGITNFLNPIHEKNDLKTKLHIDTYTSQIEKLILNSKISDGKIIQVSKGLVFACMKLKKIKLYNRIFHRKMPNLEKIGHDAVGIAKQTIKPNSPNNSIILGQLLYNPDFTDKNTRGTIPLFWHPIHHKALKKLYFADCIIISFFNPVHLIEDIESLGYIVESKYAEKKDHSNIYPKKVVENFDLFISPVINFLMAEDYVINSIKEIEKQNIKSTTRIKIKTQQHYPVI